MFRSIPPNTRGDGGWVRNWQVWATPTLLQGYLLVVCSGWLAATCFGLSHTRFRLSDGAVFALLVGCGTVAVEATRRQGEPDGTLTKDLLSAWFLPIALVLPPVYALLAPVPLTVLTQCRVKRSPYYRLSLSAAAIGLAHGLASVLFHAATADWDPAGLRSGSIALRWAGLALVGALIATAANVLLVVIAVKIFAPENSWCSLLWNPEHRRTDAGEVCIGVILGLLCVLQPLLALIALPPVVLLQRALLHDQLRAAARLDPKTGLLNAPTWENEAAGEIARAVQRGTPLSLLLLDLDRFKAVNDHFGHLAGDEVLKSVADVIRAESRESDLCGRFGGDEFTLLLPQADLGEANRTAERIRRQVSAIALTVGEQLVRTSISIGMAQLPARGQEITDLLSAADLSLYRAKTNRNQVP